MAADDEYWSREILKSLIPWKDYGMEMLEPACDGEEVLERIPTEEPDIVLTDIDMPFLDGLALMERLKKEYPRIIAIAISGYDDFPKVKGFFVSGGYDYLLKPVDPSELRRAILKAKGILAERESPSQSLAQATPASDQTALVRQYIEQAYAQPITLSSLGELFHMDGNYLSRLYSQRYGETVTASIARLRIEHAVELMRTTDRKLEDISFQVGYDDYHYFNRVFRKRIGKSPSEYRRGLSE